MKPKILLVDDDSDITAQLSTWLKLAGFEVAIAPDGQEGLTVKHRFQPDVIVLDIDMPEMDGREMLRRLREDDKLTRVIILSKMDNQIIETLSEGANVVFAKKEAEGSQSSRFANIYLDKPFTAPELLAYIRCMLTDRENLRAISQPADATQLTDTSVHPQQNQAIIYQSTSHQLSYDPSSGRIRLGGNEIKLTLTERNLLIYMMERPDRLLTRDRLLEDVWKIYEADTLEAADKKIELETRTVDTTIARLRRKLKLDGNPDASPFIETVSGQGYRFLPQ